MLLCDVLVPQGFFWLHKGALELHSAQEKEPGTRPYFLPRWPTHIFSQAKISAGILGRAVEGSSMEWEQAEWKDRGRQEYASTLPIMQANPPYHANFQCLPSDIWQQSTMMQLHESIRASQAAL